ncbi:lysoplasmalogenase TMEM86A [Culicoides brevitarsis]|uniref:lysoplasmalogenase TMEM86A n=1 Tax=Culicoides brevitarsis TaxID=469753 RepID=UPI00307B2AF6
MDYIIQLMKKTGLKIVPFIKTVVIYFMLHTYKAENHGQLWSTVVKILPIISLMIFVCLHDTKTKKGKHGSQYILLGLIFSSIGDILLNVDLFPEGMGAFAVAQAFYITSFGFKPLKMPIGLVLYTVGVLAVSLFYMNLPTILQMGLPIYGVLLLTMCWRALARATDNPCDMKNFPKLACALGAVLFVISDSLIAFDKFYIPLSFAQLAIMITYYAAQLGITLSIVELDCNKTKHDAKKIHVKNHKQKAQ